MRFFPLEIINIMLLSVFRFGACFKSVVLINNYRLKWRFVQRLQNFSTSKSEGKDPFNFILSHVKANNLREAFNCYHDVKILQSPSRQYMSLNLLLGGCHKEKDLNIALEVFDEMSQMHMIPNEASYLALIRCMSDKEDIDAAIETTKKMVLHGVELKLRSCQPILEGLCRQGKSGLLKAFEFIRFMKEHNVRLNSEQIVTIASTMSTNDLFSEVEFVDFLDGLLIEYSKYMCGMNQDNLIQLASSIRKQSEVVISEEGILVDAHFRNDRQNKVLDGNNRSEDAHINTDKFTPVQSSNQEYHYIDNLNPFVKEAVLVNMSNASCLCPNCGSVLQRILLSQEETHRVETALLDIAEKFSQGHLQYLKVIVSDK